MQRIPYDLTAEFRAVQRAHRRARLIACCGAAVFCLLAGLGLGVLAGTASPLRLLGILAISAWGCWGLRYVLTRH